MLSNKYTLATKAALNIAIVGESNSVIRTGYTKYLQEYLRKITNRQIQFNHYALGGVTNIHALMQNVRHEIATNHDIIFYDYAMNSRYAIKIGKYSLELAGRALEGFIRSVKSVNPHCIIVILIFGVNQDYYYQNDCALSALYESIGKHYELPVINLTTLLIKDRGLDFLKSLYNEKDDAHYSRPEGVKIISNQIVKSLENLDILEFLQLNSHGKDYQFEKTSQIYQDNFEKLDYLDSFENKDLFTGNPKVSVYQNTVFRERNLTIYSGMSLDFLLKGKLMAILIKSDLNDGFFSIEFGSQCLITSSFSSWVNRIKPQNVISLISLPALKFSASQNFTPVSISLCSSYPQEFELDLFKTSPRKNNPRKWKLSIIGIGYLGEIMPC